MRSALNQRFVPGVAARLSPCSCRLNASFALSCLQVVNTYSAGASSCTCHRRGIAAVPGRDPLFFIFLHVSTLVQHPTPMSRGGWLSRGAVAVHPSSFLVRLSVSSSPSLGAFPCSLRSSSLGEVDMDLRLILTPVSRQTLPH